MGIRVGIFCGDCVKKFPGASDDPSKFSSACCSGKGVIGGGSVSFWFFVSV